MNVYFSTFITGFGDIVAGELAKRLRGVEIVLLTDGLVIYKTTSSVEEIKKLRFLNNSFVLLKKFDKISEGSIKNILKSLIQDQNLVNIVRQSFPEKNLKFRIRASIKNQFVTSQLVYITKNYTMKITRNGGLSVKC